MRAISLPPTPYHAIAERPAWSDLPAELRTAIGDRLGATVAEATVSGGGFTRGFAATLRTVAGQRAFVKAARLADQRHLVDWYHREVAVTSALPAAVPAARPRWSLAAAGYYVICLDPIDGHIPTLPWRPAELTAALDAWARTAEALREPSAELLAVGLPRLADLLRADLSTWQWVAAGEEPMPPAPPAAAVHLRELVALEAALPAYADTTALTHCDLRVDNVIIDGSGAAWICDWNWLCVGAPWFDTVMLLITAYASGLDADALFEAHPTAAGAPPEALDATLATLAGYALSRSTDPPTDASSHVRAHQRWTGGVAFDWLAARRAW
jgi:aminoglycoside phosphotransferase (APT) family kinase protein